MSRALQLKPSLLKNNDSQAVLQFLEDFRQLQGDIAYHQGKSHLVSIKIPEGMLRAFRSQCNRSGVKYQTMIKRLMVEWLTLK